MKGDSSGAITNSAKFTNNCAILTTTSNLKPNNQVMYLTMPQQIPIGEEVIASYPILIEYVEGMENWDIPYFSGMQSVKMPVLTTTGKNLFDGEYVFGAINDGTGQFTANHKNS